MPSRRLLYVKAVQGECRAKRNAAGFSFSMPIRRLLYEKVLRESALLLPRWGDKAGWPGNPGCRLATLGFALGCELYAPSGRSLTALNFYRTPIFDKTPCWLLAKISRTVPTHSLPPHPFRWQREAEKFIVSLCDVDYSLHSSDDQPLELLWNSPSKVSFPGVRLWSTVASFPKTEAQRKPSVRKL